VPPATRPPSPEPTGTSGVRAHWPVVAGGAALLAVFAVCLAVPALRHALASAAHGDLDGLRSRLLDLGAAGLVVLVAVVLIHTVVPFPAEVPTAVGAFVYGIAVAVPVMAASFLVSALLGYGLGYRAGRPLTRSLLGPARLAGAERLVSRGGARALLLLRLMPLAPFAVICVACGIVRVPLRRYAWTTMAGMLPQIVLVCALASRLQHASASDPVLWASGLALTALVAAGPPVLRRMRRDVRSADAASPAEGSPSSPAGSSGDLGTL